jgi:hypothetical protein
MIEHMQNDHPAPDQRKLSPLKRASHPGAIIGAVVFICLLALLLYPDPLVNVFIKPRITKAFEKAYPAYSLRIADMNYSVFKNRFGFDSLALSRVNGTFSGNMGPISVSGIHWMHLLWGGRLVPTDYANSVVEAQNIVLNFPQSQYELRCGPLRVSVPDSEIVVEAISFNPVGDDEQAFAGSAFRKTRYRLIVPQVTVTGFAGLELLKGRNYHARSAQIHDAFLDVLINKDKPNARKNSSPPMPNEILSSLKGTLQVDSLSVMNGRVMYGERLGVGLKPAFITFDSVQVLAEGIANQGDPGDVIVIHAQGTFMKAGTMNILMSIPVVSPELSFQYSGSLSRMDISTLNSYFETANQVRIKEGVLQTASFQINVVSGRASGGVRAIYRDLKLAVIDEHTRSEKGFFDGLSSFYVNTVKIRKNNVPNKSGLMKIGEVNYTRMRNDPFLGFAWSALRTGVRDVTVFK